MLVVASGDARKVKGLRSSRSKIDRDGPELRALRDARFVAALGDRYEFAERVLLSPETADSVVEEISSAPVPSIRFLARLISSAVLQ